MPTKSQVKEQARRRKANQRAREAGMPEPYPAEAEASTEEQSAKEQQHLLDLAWAKELDESGVFYKSECRSAMQLLAIYEGNNNVTGEDLDAIDPKTGKKKQNIPNPSRQAIRIHAVQTTEKIGELEYTVKIDPNMKEYRKVMEVDH